MSSIPLSHAKYELNDTNASVHCSFCKGAVPEHLQGEQPCPLCHEFSFLCEPTGEDKDGRTTWRMAGSRQSCEFKPLIAGRMRPHEL